jgi:hypothetical protein
MTAFVRVYLSDQDGRRASRHRAERALLRKRGTRRADGAEPLEMRELGFAEDHDWTDLEGKPCSPARHITCGCVTTGTTELPRIHDCPTSLEASRRGFAKRGLAGLHGRVRAYLANILSARMT